MGGSPKFQEKSLKTAYAYFGITKKSWSAFGLTWLHWYPAQQFIQTNVGQCVAQVIIYSVKKTCTMWMHTELKLNYFRRQHNKCIFQPLFPHGELHVECWLSLEIISRICSMADTALKPKTKDVRLHAPSSRHSHAIACHNCTNAAMPVYVSPKFLKLWWKDFLFFLTSSARVLCRNSKNPCANAVPQIWQVQLECIMQFPSVGV